jgi:WD40 repeat protein
MRRRDFIKTVGGLATSLLAPARGLLGGAVFDATAQLVTSSPVAAQDVPKLTIEIVPQIGHSDWVSCAAFSPDGRIIVSGGQDNRLKLWDASTGYELRTLWAHSASVPTDPRQFESVHAVAFSPDGRVIVSASDTIKLWDTASGRELRTLHGKDETVGPVTFSPNGETIISGGDDGTLALWNIASGRVVRTFIVNRNWPVGAAAFSPDGRTIAASGFNQLKLWDAASGRELRTLVGPRIRISAFAFSPNGQTIVSGSGNSNGATVTLWDLASGRELRTIAEHGDFVNAVAVSPDGRMIVSGSSNPMGDQNFVTLRDAESGRELHTFTGHTYTVTSVAFSPDGRTVLSGSRDRTLKLWNVEDSRERHTLSGHGAAVNAVAFSPDGRTVAAGSADNALTLWDARSGRALRTIKGHTNSISAVAFSSDGGTIVSGSDDNTLKLWDAATGRELRTLSGDSDVVSAVAFSPDGKTIVSASALTLKLWDTTTGRELHTLEGHRVSIFAAAFAPDGRTIVSGSYDTKLILWDAMTGRLLRILKGHGKGDNDRNAADKSGITSVAFSPDSRTIVSGSRDRTLKLWNAASGRELRTLAGHTSSVSSVVFSPDGRLIASGSEDNTIKLWDAANGRELHTLVGHMNSVNSVTFSSDGRSVVSGGKDGTVRLWNVAGELLATSIAGSDDEWLTITPEGFFDSSDSGTNLLAAVRGLEVYSINQFYQQLYRPDVVRQKLAFDSGRVRYAADKVSLVTILASKAPPEVTIVSPQAKSETDQDSIAVEAKLVHRDANNNGGIGRVEWRVNGVTRAVQDLQGAVDGAVTKVVQKLALPKDTSVIEMVAYNKANLAASLPVAVAVTSTAPRSPQRLYVLALGVDKYRYEVLNLKYAVADTKAFSAAFNLPNAGKGLYEQVIVCDPMLNEAVTAENLRRKFEELGKVIRPDDVFVLYMAGHGVTDNGRYWYIAHDSDYEDGDFDKLVDTSIGQDQLQTWLTLIPAFRSVLIYDTCESGSTVEDRSGFRGAQRLVAVEKLSQSIGRTVLAASSDVKDALEGYPPNAGRKHGIFTYVLLDAFALADINKDEMITTESLATYLRKHLPDLTEKIWNSRQEPQVNLSGASFALLGRVKIEEINELR